MLFEREKSDFSRLPTLQTLQSNHDNLQGNSLKDIDTEEGMTKMGKNVFSTGLLSDISIKSHGY